MRKPLVAFAYYGGKTSHLKWLLPLLPQTDYYCEPFGGSAAVLLNRQPSKIETYNDLESEVVNFFRVLRSNPNELVRLITYTPYAREEFVNALKYEGDSELERARKFFVRIRQSFGAQNIVATQGDWSSHHKGKPSGMQRFRLGDHILYQVANRLLNIQIENRSAIEVIQNADHRRTLFYLDPPYDGDTCDPSYKYKFSSEEFKKLAPVLNKLNGKVAVSGYRSALLDKLFKDWNRIEIPSKNQVSVRFQRSAERERVEVLWTNYDPYQTRRLF